MSQASAQSRVCVRNALQRQRRSSRVFSLKDNYA